MATEQSFQLHNCRGLFEKYPSSTSLRAAVEVIERTIWDEPGIAFTHCRGLLETVCISILADRGIETPPESKPNWLMSQTVQSLELTSRTPDDKDAERGIAGVLKGLNLLVDGIVALRNSQGVGPHGRDALERVLSVEYAIVTASTVDTAVGLLFRLHQEQLARDPLNHLRFGKHSDFDDYLDDKYSDLVVEEVPISASQALFHQDRRAYHQSLVEFRFGGVDVESDITEGATLSEDASG